VDVLKGQGIVPGIKVDTGLQPLPGTDGETATQGLDGLADRCAAYYKQGARFAKWRAVLNAGGGRPSNMAIAENAHGLARYAQIAQHAGLVPIVEPEVTLGPGDYSIEETAFVSERVYTEVVAALNLYNGATGGREERRARGEEGERRRERWEKKQGLERQSDRAAGERG
jgi:fructose-bisphosphate aldolase class I